MNYNIPTSLSELAKLYSLSYDSKTGGYLTPPRHLVTKPFTLEDVNEWKIKCTEFPMYDSIELEVAIALYSIIRLTGAKNILETGCSRGFSTCFLAAGVSDNNGGKVTTVDTVSCFHLWEGSNLEKFINFNQMQSFDLYKNVENEQFDMLFLDSLHTYKNLMEEIMIFERKLKIGGILVLHDTLFYDGLGFAANSLLENPRYETINLPTPRRHKNNSRCPGITVSMKISDDIEKYPFYISQKYINWDEETFWEDPSIKNNLCTNKKRDFHSESILDILRNKKINNMI